MGASQEVGKRAFPASRRSDEADHPVGGKVERDVLEGAMILVGIGNVTQAEMLRLIRELDGLFTVFVRVGGVDDREKGCECILAVERRMVVGCELADRAEVVGHDDEGRQSREERQRSIDEAESQHNGDGCD